MLASTETICSAPWGQNKNNIHIEEIKTVNCFASWFGAHYCHHRSVIERQKNTLEVIRPNGEDAAD